MVSLNCRSLVALECRALLRRWADEPGHRADILLLQETWHLEPLEVEGWEGEWSDAPPGGQPCKGVAILVRQELLAERRVGPIKRVGYVWRERGYQALVASVGKLRFGSVYYFNGQGCSPERYEELCEDLVGLRGADPGVGFIVGGDFNWPQAAPALCDLMGQHLGLEATLKPGRAVTRRGSLLDNIFFSASAGFVPGGVVSAQGLSDHDAVAGRARRGGWGGGEGGWRGGRSNMSGGGAWGGTGGREQQRWWQRWRPRWGRGRHIPPSWMSRSS